MLRSSGEFSKYRLGYRRNSVDGRRLNCCASLPHVFSCLATAELSTRIGWHCRITFNHRLCYGTSSTEAIKHTNSTDWPQPSAKSQSLETRLWDSQKLFRIGACATLWGDSPARFAMPQRPIALLAFARRYYLPRTTARSSTPGRTSKAGVRWVVGCSRALDSRAQDHRRLKLSRKVQLADEANIIWSTFMIAGLFVWGPPSFVISAAIAYFVVRAIIGAFVPRCPYCRGTVHASASKCCNCGSDLPIIAAPSRQPIAIEKPRRAEIPTPVAVAVIAVFTCPPFLLLMSLALGPDSPDSRESSIEKRIGAFAGALVILAVFVGACYFARSRRSSTPDPSTRLSQRTEHCPKCAASMTSDFEMGQPVYHCTKCHETYFA